MNKLLTGGAPICDGSVGNYFEILLTASLTVPSVINMKPGVLYTFNIAQDGDGGREWQWPNNVFNGNRVTQKPNSRTVQTFIAIRDATLFAITPNQWIGA
jgi:hypothetical protein